jgi:hypothetical protein
VRRSATSELTRPGHKSRSQEQVTRAGHKNRAQCGGYLSRQWQSHQRNGRDLTGIVHRHGHALTGSQQPQTARVERDPAERHNGSIVEEGCPRSAQRVVASHRRLQCPHRPAPPALPLRPCPSGPAPPALPLRPCLSAPAALPLRAAQRSPTGRRSVACRIRSMSSVRGTPVAAHISGKPEPGVIPGIVLISLTRTLPSVV